jgi:cell division protein FtsW
MCLVSIVEVYSSASASRQLVQNEALFMYPIMKHIGMIVIGFVAILIIQNFEPILFRKIAKPFLFFSILLLIMTIFVGKSINDATRWVSFFGIPFQPLEFAKLSIVLYLALILSEQKYIGTDMNLSNLNSSFWRMLISTLIIFILILPENYSTAILIMIVSLLIMFIGQAHLKKLIITTTIFVTLGFLVILAFKSVPPEFADKYLPSRFETWQNRINTWWNDNNIEVNDDNYQTAQAKIAIARGSLTGILPGRSIARFFLPVAYADFIYAIIIEEMGLIFGGIGVLCLYILLLFRAFYISKECNTFFSKYVLIGLTLMIVIQALVNMSVAVDLLPVTGQPLPLISMGGTSTIITSIYFGLILSISKYRAGIDS